MSKISFQKMVSDPFSLFNIFMTLIFSMVLTSILSIPLLELFIFRPEGETILTGIFTRTDLLETPLAVFLLSFVLNAAFISMVYLRLKYPGKYSLSDIGVKISEPLRSIQAGVVYGLAVIFLMFMISIMIASTGLEPDAPFGIPETVSGLILVLIAGAIMAPAGEELFFRAYVVTALKKRYNIYFTYFFSASFFALLHLDIIGLIPIFIIGVILAYVFDKYNNVLPCMIIHGMYNFVAIMALYYSNL